MIAQTVRRHGSRNYSNRPASTVSLSIGRGYGVRTARVPLVYPCRYVREKLSVRESDRRCSPLAFCRRRISVGRAHLHRRRMFSIRPFRTKLTFRRNIPGIAFNVHVHIQYSCSYSIFISIFNIYIHTQYKYSYSTLIFIFNINVYYNH